MRSGDEVPAASAGRRWTLGDADWNSWPAGRTDEQVWARARRLGLHGVEVGVYDADVELAQAREERRRSCASDGPPVAAVLVSLPPSRWPAGALTTRTAEAVGLARAAARSAAGHGALLGLWPGADTEEVPGAGWGALVDGAAALVDAVGPVALEPKPGTLLADVDALLALAAQVPGVRGLLDTGHAWAGGTDPARDVARLADAGLLAHVHLGDAHPGGADDDLPLGAVHDPAPLLGALDRMGFAGHASFDLYGAALAAADGGGATGGGGGDPVEVSVRAVRAAA